MEGSEPGLNEALLEKCKQGDHEAWQQFKKAIWPWLVALLTRSLKGDQELAEEIAHRTFIALYELDCARLKRHDPRRGALPTFLFAVARRELGKELRKRAIRREVPLHVCPPTKLTVSPCYLDFDLKELADSLSPRLRYHLDNRCLKDGDQSGAPRVSESCCRQLDHRIREKMGVRLRTIPRPLQK